MFLSMERQDPSIPGRGAQSARVPDRFGLAGREVDGDWRDAMEALDGPPVKLRTTVTEEHPKTILSFNQSPDLGFDRSVNAYRGCEHGCVYCFARPTHAFHDLSPGLDFETKLFAKPAAAALLRETLARPRYRPKPIAMGTNTDPYQPIEARYCITRQVLEVCLEARHPVTITTKSDRVLRDLDLLDQLARQRLVAVAISVTTFDARLSRLLEPRAPAPAKRLAALGRLVEHGPLDPRRARQRSELLHPDEAERRLGRTLPREVPPGPQTGGHDQVSFRARLHEVSAPHDRGPAIAFRRRLKRDHSINRNNPNDSAVPSRKSGQDQ